VTFNSSRVEVDLERLERGDILGTDTQLPLHVAGFLEGFDIPDAPEFALWKDRTSAKLLPAIKAALVQLMDQCRRTADARQIEHWADIMLSIDDLSEEAVRAKMEARAFAGDRLTALRVFEEWRVKLSEAVGAQPSSLIEGMAVRLRRRGWERTDLSDIPTVPTDQWRGRPFVGRFDEYRLLYEAWEHTKRGRARHALVLGDSGIGKTTLVNRLATAAGLEGAAVSRAQCYDLERDIPYATLGNLTIGLLELPGISATPPDVLAELARYFAPVRRRFPSIPTGQDTQGETARLRLTEAFHHTLETIAEEHPVILVVDDLHLCDEASLSVLHLLMHRVPAQPIMVVLVARAEELSHSPPAARFRVSAHSLGIQEIEITPLSERESTEVLEALTPSWTGLDSPLRRNMVRAAGGFPMVLELLVQDWEANGSQSLALALDSMTADLGSVSEAPDVYQRVLDRLVVALGHGTKSVLNIAAVLGHRLNDLTLYSIADLGPGQVMAALGDLVRHRVLRDSGRGLEFVNELVRTAVYLEVPSPVRRTLHAGIAAKLKEEIERGVPVSGLEIAWHVIRAGQLTALGVHLLDGATEAIAQGALDTAARALRTALPQLTKGDRVMAALLLAEALQEQGRWTESASVLGAECADEQTGLAVVFSILATHRTTASSVERLVSDLEHLRSLVDSTYPVPVRLKAANAAAQLMGDVRDQSLAQGLLTAVATLRHGHLTEDEQVQLHLCRAQLMYYSGQQAATLEALTSLVNLFQSKGIVNSRLARVHAGLGAVRCFQGMYVEARTEFKAGYSVAVRIGNEAQQAILAAQLALCSLRLGEYKEQLEWSATASQAGQFSQYQGVQVAYYRAFALAMLGDSTGAVRAFSTLESRVFPESPPWLIQAWKLLRADILSLSGHHTAALSQGRDAVGLPRPVLHSASFAGAFARWLALTSQQEEIECATRPILDGLEAKLEDLDTIDRVEVLCAQLLVQGAKDAERKFHLQRYLAGLSPAVASQLTRLGVLGN
jgi:hypothetical protein